MILSDYKGCNMEVLRVENLSVSYSNKQVLHNINFTVNEGEIISLVGESGSGKTTIFRAIQRFLPPNGKIINGNIFLNGENTTDINDKKFYNLRGRTLGTVFQEPGSTLNPSKKIGRQFYELLNYHFKYSKKQSEKIAVDLMNLLHLRDPIKLLNQYPFQLSGGMQQRLSIAFTLSLNPKIILADEPTSSLDATVQKQIIDELIRLRNELGIAIVIITHNLALANYISDRMIVLYEGRIVESGVAEDIIARPNHEYTKKLISDIPKIK